MAKARQLKEEIEKTLEQVDEGCNQFNQTLSRINSAVNQTQKERFDQELKKEIKKLQRLREKLRNYQTNSEIRDKSSIVDARKNIEELMATYRNWERESKTKAFSKTGLATVPKPDPQEEEKDRAREWIRNSQEELIDGINKFEAELEQFRVGRGQKIDVTKIERLKIQHQSYSFQYEKLEQVLRSLENDTLDLTKFEEMKSRLEMFLENTPEQEYIESELEEIYKELELNFNVTVPNTVPSIEEEETKKTVIKKQEVSKPTKAPPKSSEVPKTESVWAKREEEKSEDSDVEEIQDPETLKNGLQLSYENYLRPQERERSKIMVLKSPHQGYTFYPQRQLFTDVDQYKKLELDTLFFIFYHQPGTYQQYLAAKELKKKEWIYHKRFQTWFQRHGELKAANSESEKGSYVYFDFETNWSQRKKADFEFEYTHLENELS